MKHVLLQCSVAGLTFNSILFGIGLVLVKGRGRVVFLFFDGVFAVLMQILLASVWRVAAVYAQFQTAVFVALLVIALYFRLYPLALMSMIATTVVEIEDPIGLIRQMLVFLLTVLLGLFCHAVFVLPLIFFVFVRRNPYKHMYKCTKALVTAFATNNRCGLQTASLASAFS